MKALISLNGFGFNVCLEIATEQRLLLRYACEIPLCYCRMRKFSAKSGLRVNSADFEVRENDQIIRDI